MPGLQHRTGNTDGGCAKQGGAVDFEFDATTDGLPIKIVSVVDCTPVNASATWSTARSPPGCSSTNSTASPAAANY